MAQLRVLTYNIRKGKGGYSGPVTVELLADRIAGRSPDIFLCQEVFHSHQRDGAFQSAELARRLQFNRIYAPNARYRRGHHGNATFTRFPVRRSFHRDVSTNPIERRGLIYTMVDGHGGPIHVINTHLGLNKWQRRKQVDRIAQFMSEVCRDEHPVLLAGDFNDWTGQLDRQITERCGLVNALGALSRRWRRSWPSTRPIFGLDRIYYRGLRLLDIRVLRHSPWHLLSDHLPVEAEFRCAS